MTAGEQGASGAERVPDLQALGCALYLEVRISISGNPCPGALGVQDKISI